MRQSCKANRLRSGGQCASVCGVKMGAALLDQMSRALVGARFLVDNSKLMKATA